MVQYTLPLGRLASFECKQVPVEGMLAAKAIFHTSTYLEKHIRSWSDALLEQDAERPVLLFQVKYSGLQLYTLLPQVL